MTRGKIEFFIRNKIQDQDISDGSDNKSSNNTFRTNSKTVMRIQGINGQE